MPLVATSRITGRIRSGQLGARGETTFILASWTSARARARAGKESAIGLFAREIIEDRTVRPIVAMAGGDQLSKRVRHSLHFSDPRLEIADMRLGDALDFAAWAAAIAP